MYTDIRLFLQGTELEFSTPPQILYNYNVTDFTNPTIVKNGYSKSITVEGTPSNNALFDHIFRSDRHQAGSVFNPMKRAPFELYVNGELYEKGYAKLNNIKQNGQKTEFEIQLFGGIGSFFYSLSYFDDSDRKKTLADLQYINLDMGLPEPDMDFEINKENINDAWQHLFVWQGENSRWDIINFAVTSEGKPDDFDCNKVLINGHNNGYFSKQDGDYKTVLGTSLSTDGFSLGEAAQEMTVNQTLDLRSYLLRPVINVKRVIDAITNPDVNGGYEVVLDSHFFDKSLNHYYGYSWMTLPMLRELSVERQEVSSTTATASLDGNWYRVNVDMPFGAVNGDVELTIQALFNKIDGIGDAFQYYPYHYLATDATRGWENVRTYEFNQGLIVQMFAFDASNNIVSRSNAFYLGGSDTDFVNHRKMWAQYAYLRDSNIQYINGYYRNLNNRCVFSDQYGNPVNLKFKVNIAGATRIAVYFEKPRCYEAYAAKGPESRTPRMEWKLDAPTMWLYTTQNEFRPGNYSAPQIIAWNRVTGNFGMEIKSVRLSNIEYSTLFSHSLITKEKLLGTPFTPAEFLLSYAKLFGLYFFQDPSEPSSDEVRYPSGVIHICDRDTFYKEEYKDLEESIDHSREIKINPVVATAKFYRFSLEDMGSLNEDRYESTYGYTYGRQLVDVGSDFDSETNDLYDESIFKNGVMVQERSKYFSFPTNGLPSYTNDGIKYNLYKPNGSDYDTKEKEYSKRVVPQRPIAGSGMTYYDLMPTLQCHSEDNDPVDGSYVLLFYDGPVEPTTAEYGNFSYMITDDLDEMALLNDGTACWLLTDNEQYDGDGNRIAIRALYLPKFTRDIVRNGNIIHSWNFGHPRETYVPMVFTTEGDSIYDMFWRSYISDMYSVDSRIMTAYVRFDGRPNPSMLRSYYWFDNALWRINRIVDWNISAFEPTKCEFLKVIDEDAYKLLKVSYRGIIRFDMDSYVISSSGGVINGKVIVQDPTNCWAFADVFTSTDGRGNQTTYSREDYISPLNGCDAETTYFSVNIPEWSGDTDRVFSISVEDSSDVWYRLKITQNAAVTAETPYAAFLDSDFYVTDLGGTFSASVSSNTIWVLSANTDWITVDSSQQLGNGNAWFTVNEYLGSNPRSATLYTRMSDGSNGGMLTVHQDENYEAWSVHPTYDNVETGSSMTGFTLDVYDPSDEWTAVPTVDWMTVSPSAGTGNATIVVTIPANTGWRRSGYVNIYDVSGNVRCKYQVTQFGERMDSPLSVPSTSYTVDCRYNTITIPVTSEIPDLEWTAHIWGVSNREFISLNQTTFIGDDTLVVSVLRLDASEDRSVRIQLRPKGGDIPSIDVYITQTSC